MIVKITNIARVKDYIAVLGNSVTIVKGSDEKFALHDADASIIVKAIAAGKGFVIEDTTLTVNGTTYNTLREVHERINNGDEAVWSTKIAYHSGHMIHFYEADIAGRIRIVPSEHDETLSFGDLFVPEGHDLTLCEMERKDLPFENARRRALKKMLLCEPFHTEYYEPCFQNESPDPEETLPSLETDVQTT